MLKWTHKHIPINVSLCRNVNGNTIDICLVNADQDQLVEKMFSNMNQIAQRVYQLAMWSWVLEAINEKLKESKQDELLSKVDLDDCTDDKWAKRPRRITAILKIHLIHY